MNHEPEDDLDWDSRVADIYRDVIDGAEGDGMDRSEAIKHTIAQVAEEVEAGRLVVPPDLAVKRTIESVDDRDGRLAERVLNKARIGEDPILGEDDPFLKISATLGGGLRKTWRWVTRADLMDMDKLRYRNVKNQQDAYDRWRRQYDSWLPILDRYQFFGEAIDAGVVPDPDES